MRVPGSQTVIEESRSVELAQVRFRVFFFQAEDGIRDIGVTGVQTCALPIYGQKAWATNGGIANVHVVVASVDPELKARGQAGFVIPPGTKGLEMGTKVKKHGLRASHTADVFLDEVRVPGSCLLGGKEKLDERLARAREGQSGRSQAAMRTFEMSRPTVGAQAIGIARAAYEYALEYARDRDRKSVV